MQRSSSYSRWDSRRASLLVIDMSKQRRDAGARHVFVTAITVRPGNALSLEPKHGVGVGPFRYAHGHLARGRRYLDLAAQHGFPQRNRQLQVNVVALACEDAVRPNLD